MFDFQRTFVLHFEKLIEKCDDDLVATAVTSARFAGCGVVDLGEQQARLFQQVNVQRGAGNRLTERERDLFVADAGFFQQFQFVYAYRACLRFCKVKYLFVVVEREFHRIKHNFPSLFRQFFIHYNKVCDGLSTY